MAKVPHNDNGWPSQDSSDGVVTDDGYMGMNKI